MKLHRYFAVIVGFTLGFLSVGQNLVLGERTSTDSQIAYFQRFLKRNPYNAKAYYGLGDALIRKARETGDPAYFSRAEEALKQSLQFAPNAGATRHLAYVFYSRHEFEAAAIHAQKAIEIDSTDGAAHGILGDALLEVGQYDQAEDAYKEMIQLDDSLYSRSRLAGLKSIRGDVGAAMSDLGRAITLGKETREPAESIAWAEWQLGSDYFGLGNLNNAEVYFLQSLQTYPNYYRALAGIAQVRAAQQKYDEAIELYRKAIAILPMPEYVTGLGDIYTKIGQPLQARQQYELVEYIGKLNALNKALYNRELAYFYADHEIKPREGLELAQRELDYRRDVYAYDVVAWNLYRNGRVKEAREAVESALRLGTKDAKLFYHAGMIYHALGSKDKAMDYLARAMSINPYFHPIFADKAAQTLKQLERSTEQAHVEGKQQGE